MWKTDRWGGQICKVFILNFLKINTPRLFKSVNVWQSYSKNKKMDVFGTQGKGLYKKSTRNIKVLLTSQWCIAQTNIFYWCLHTHTHKHRDTRTQIYLLRAYTNTLLSGYRKENNITKTAKRCFFFSCLLPVLNRGWLGSRVVSVQDSGAEGPGFKSQSRRCRVTVLVLVPLFTKQQNWYQPS